MLPYGPIFKPPLECTPSNCNAVFVMEVLYELIDIKVFVVEGGELVSIGVKVDFRASS
jgi:hypothetical protein